jgi:hypothetical protein
MDGIGDRNAVHRRIAQGEPEVGPAGYWRAVWFKLFLIAER